MVYVPNCSVVCLRAFMRRTPLEIFAQTALYLAGKNPAKAAQILAFAEKTVMAYDKFLAILADERKREHLEKLAQVDIDSDPLFAEASTKPFTQRSRERELNERSIDLCRRLENVGIARKEALDVQTEPRVGDRRGARELHRF